MASGTNDERRVAFVTGGSRGVGLGTALGLGRQGIEVVIGGRDIAQGDNALKRLREAGIIARFVEFDVCEPDDHMHLCRLLDEGYGKLDILVNNAGLMLEGPRTELDLPNTTLDVSTWTLKRTFDVNFFGVVGLTQTLLPLLRKAPAGRIVNVTSILASLNIYATSDDPRLPNHRQLAYNTSKTALNAFTIHLARTLEDTDIKVNAAHPGWVRTNMGGEDAELSIEEGAATSVMLATLPSDGPTGVFRHADQMIPW